MSITKYHARWLSLIEISGPFLSLPVLSRVFPQGLDAHDPDHFRLLRQVHEEWEDNQNGAKPHPAIHTQWVRWVLRNTLEYDDAIVEGPEIPPTLKAEIEEPQHRETLRPDMVLMGPDKKANLLIHVYPPTQKLTKPVTGRAWKASPDTRMTQLLRDSGVPLGLITNGEHWMFVYAQVTETSGYASWYATLWLEEPDTLAAFRTLLGMYRFFGVAADQSLLAMMAESAKDQLEVTDRLGYQVRSAVEILVQSLDRADQEYGRELLQDVPESVLYEASLTVMMRLVFLFCAEERELLLLGDPLYDQHYAVSTLVAQLQETADEYGEEILERRLDAWNRLLSTFRAVYGGVSHDRMRLPAYGGGLFDPDRFPFLEGRKPKTKWTDAPANPLPVNNRTVLHLLRSLQYLELHGEAQRLSFRALGIEQIGHVYEGLLDHTAKRASEPILGLIGKKEPEISLAELEKQRATGDDAFHKFLKDETGSTRRWHNAIDQELSRDDANRLRSACGNEEDLFGQVQPLAGLVRNDSFGRPVVVRKGSVYVTAGTDRRSSGTHYTPRTLTEPIVQYTLEPLVYVGPAEGKERSEWQLKSAEELLELKICDMACGSGAFLVQAARYMAERLGEAWEKGSSQASKSSKQDVPTSAAVESATAIENRDQLSHGAPETPLVAEDLGSYRNVARPALLTTPTGSQSIGRPEEQLIPSDPSERRTYAMRIVAQRCLYGVDVNPLAVEMAKLSLWLLTLAKDKPFEFLDHAIRCGDSLVGIHDINQLKNYSLQKDNKIVFEWPGEFEDPVDAAIKLRLKLEDLPSNTVEDIEEQERMLREADDKIARLRSAADLLVAAEFWGENVADKLERVRHAAVMTGYYVEKGPTEEFQDKAAVERRGQRMFHWPLEFPEVIVKRGGFDAFIGNPPFLGRRNLATSLGEWYRSGLTSLWPSVAAGADLCVYFFNRAFFQLLNGNATLGLLACNTIAQGATRESGLEAITADGGEIYRANSSVRWPGTANVFVSLVYVCRHSYAGPRCLDGGMVSAISSSLDASAENSAYPLAENNHRSFQGFIPLGSGFNIPKAIAHQLIEKDKRNAEVIFPCLNGRQLYSSPSLDPDNWIIFFRDLDEEACRSYSDVYALLRGQLYLERQAQKQEEARRYWWRFWRTRPDLRHAVNGIPRMIATAFTSSTVAFAFVPTNMVCTNALVVFAFDSWAAFGVLQSSIHQSWALQYGSTMKQDLRYTPTVCFQPFPIPKNLEIIEKTAQEYYVFRGECMVRRNEGLTTIYNLIHDPDERSADVSMLREHVVKNDHCVSAAYAWDEIDLGHDFHETKQGIRFTISEEARREVLQRLLKLNHERYAEEVKQGLHDKNRGKKAALTRGAVGKKPTRKKAAKKPSATPSMFGDDDEGG